MIEFKAVGLSQAEIEDPRVVEHQKELN